MFESVFCDGFPGDVEVADVIESIDEVLDPANANVFFRNRLVLKPKTAEEKLLYTMDDE